MSLVWGWNDVAALPGAEWGPSDVTETTHAAGILATNRAIAVVILVSVPKITWVEIAKGL